MPWDAIVVGAGSAGCVVAARLAEDRWRRVLLLEAGPRPPDEMLSGMRAYTPGFDWDLADIGGEPVARGKGLGGSSAINFGAWTRGESDDYEWGHPDWTYASFESAFRRLDLQVPVDRTAPTDAASEGFLAAAEALGLPWNQSLGLPGERGRGPLARNLVGRKRVSAAISHLSAPSDNLQIRLETTVTRVVPGGVMVGEERLEADDVILCAGAYHSPWLLQTSGIGRQLPVGEGLQEHPGAFFLLNAPHGAPSDECSPLVVIDDAHIMLFSADAFGMSGMSALIVFFLSPQSRGYVRPGVFDRGLLADGRDMNRFWELLEVGAELCGDAEVVMSPGERGQRPVNLFSYNHPVGSCGFGSVVDGRLRILGEENLYVCDATVFPRIPRAGTNQPTMAVAERFAELFRTDHDRR